MKIVANQSGFTYIFVLTVVMIMGIMLGMVGQSWKTIMQREREKELLFRGSQIKEAIENWNKPKNTVPGINQPLLPPPLMDLKDLLQDPNSLTMTRYLPHSYAAELDDKNPKCSPDCAKLKVYQDPMTGKEWTIIRGTITATPGGPPVGGVISIIGVASKSDETPFRTDFKDTALENLGVVPVDPKPKDPSDMGTPPPDSGDKKPKYSQWQFIAEAPAINDHTKIYRAYHEGW
jgi:type II secretory pathway pseudopilin PulG